MMIALLKCSVNRLTSYKFTHCLSHNIDVGWHVVVAHSAYCRCRRHDCVHHHLDDHRDPTNRIDHSDNWEVEGEAMTTITQWTGAMAIPMLIRLGMFRPYLCHSLAPMTVTITGALPRVSILITVAIETKSSP